MGSAQAFFASHAGPNASTKSGARTRLDISSLLFAKEPQAH